MEKSGISSSSCDVFTHYAIVYIQALGLEESELVSEVLVVL